MLLTFKVKNFLSFKDEIEFSMIANKDLTLENSLLKIKKDFRLKKSALIYGPNGSGKSNLIKAIRFLQYLVIYSKNFEKDSDFPESPFRLDSKFGEKKPIEFTVNFLKEGIFYTYHLKISTKKKRDYKFIIEEERLDKNGKTLFSFYESKREKNTFSSKELAEKVVARVETKNKNMLLLSFIREKNFDDFDDVYDWFKTDLVVSIRDTRGMFQKRILLDMYTELENANTRKEVLKYLRKLSFSKIYDIQVVKTEKDLPEILKRVKKEGLFSKKAIEEFSKQLLTEDKFERKIKLVHKNEKGETLDFDLSNDESLGTRKFIEILIFVLKATEEKKVVFIDEIEDSLHPELLKEVFKLISKISGEVQIIGSTHAYTLLQYVNSDEEIFRRDQIFFTRLLKDQATQLYSLINIGGIGSDLEIFKAYFEGRLEAFPIINNEE